ncbi:MAG: hypothetical protein ACTSRX_00220 [Promethearchaeota archaeon]
MGQILPMAIASGISDKQLKPNDNIIGPNCIKVDACSTWMRRCVWLK